MAKNKRLIIPGVLIVVCISLLCILSSCVSSSAPKTSADAHGLQHHEGYTLEQMTVVSRHQIRSALSEHGSDLAKLNAHEWLPWSSDPSYLTDLGCVQETMMGMYFRTYLEEEKFIPVNWFPADDETYFYCNSQQRTIVSTQSFSSALLPVANPRVVYKCDFDSDDPVFWRDITKNSEAWRNQVMKEVEEQGGEAGLNGILEQNAQNFKTLEKVLDFGNSQYAKEHGITQLPLDDMKITFNYGEGPSMKGSLKLGNSASDALKLQYYEYPNGHDASFGVPLSWEEWAQIGALGDAYQKALFGSHTAAIDKANPMLKEIQADMQNPKRKFTFLGGHDDNIMSLIAALNIKDYKLESSLNSRSPVGSNFIITKYKDNSGQEFCTISLLYCTASQLRSLDILDLENPLIEKQLELEGLEKNKDGMYKLADVEKRIADTIAEYDLWQ